MKSPAPRPKVLVVDDTRANRIMMRHLLAKVDAELLEAQSGEEALAACRQHEFAVILLDVQMGDMDGFEVAQRLSQDERSRETPIVFLTATHVDELSRIKGYGSGAVDYMVRPVNDVVLVSKVQVFLDLYRGKRQLRDEIEERKRQEELVRHLATHDPLTGLPNRMLLIDFLGSVLERVRRRRTSCALLYVDIDDFKPVNDSYGHQAGDALLRDIAQRLKQAFRAVDTVARLGGDEFAVLMDEPVNAQGALAKAGQVVALLSEPYRLEISGPSPRSVDAKVGASVGIALYPEHAQGLDELVRIADEAMYRAKKAGKGRCQLAPPTAPGKATLAEPATDGP